MRTLFDTEEVKMLGFWQPFASLMFYGKIETRRRNTSYRGKVIGYSTLEQFEGPQLFELCGPEILISIVETLRDEPTKTEKGVALWIGDLVATRPMRAEDEPRCFVKYEPGRWCWFFQNLQRLDPFRVVGNQGWTNIVEASGVKNHRIYEQVKQYL
jgi:hypothetical protein